MSPAPALLSPSPRVSSRRRRRGEQAGRRNPKRGCAQYNRVRSHNLQIHDQQPVVRRRVAFRAIHQIAAEHRGGPRPQSQSPREDAVGPRRVQIHRLRIRKSSTRIEGPRPGPGVHKRRALEDERRVGRARPADESQNLRLQSQRVEGPLVVGVGVEVPHQHLAQGLLAAPERVEPRP